MTPVEEHESRISGALLGTALGDALGLVCEGLSAKVIARRFGALDRFHMLGRTGYVSDDTEQSALLAQCLARNPGDAGACVRAFRWAILGWFSRLPWGIGLATLRACVRIALGLKRSGVRSAGNGAAMRASVLGVFFRDRDDERARFGRALAEVTHTDPRGVEGALFVGEVAAACARGDGSPVECVERGLAVVREESLRAALVRAIELAKGETARDVAARELGTTGFVLHSVPFAAYCFARFGADAMGAIRETIFAGGDTDSNAAIVGAWSGAMHTERGLSRELLASLQRGPFGESHLRALARDLARAPAREARYSRAVAMGRNLLLYPVVLAHGFRRIIPW